MYNIIYIYLFHVLKIVHLSEYITDERFIHPRSPFYKLKQVHTGSMLFHYHLEVFVVFEHIYDGHLEDITRD